MDNKTLTQLPDRVSVKQSWHEDVWSCFERQISKDRKDRKWATLRNNNFESDQQKKKKHPGYCYLFYTYFFSKCYCLNAFIHPYTTVHSLKSHFSWFSLLVVTTLCLCRAEYMTILLLGVWHFLLSWEVKAKLLELLAQCESIIDWCCFCKNGWYFWLKMCLKLRHKKSCIFWL